MFANRFSVRVVSGDERDNGYVHMRHGQQYKISIRNDRGCPCDAEVRVDGKSVGVFRIESGRNILLERPENDQGKFTFYKLGTADAAAADLVDSADLGLISVTFRPGHMRPSARPLRVSPQPQWIYYEPWQPAWLCDSNTYITAGSHTVTTTSDATDSYSALNAPVAAAPGGTGLSGYSSQHFGTVEPLDYYPSQEVTIHLRLVCSEQAAARPLQPVSTPVPPPLG